MTRVKLRFAVMALVAGGATCLNAQRGSPDPLPLEPAIVLPSAPGADLTAAHCSACHSLDYVTMQPRGKGAKFWEDSVTKMRTVYHAEIPDEESAMIVGYLAQTFGEPAKGSDGRD